MFLHDGWVNLFLICSDQSQEVSSTENVDLRVANRLKTFSDLEDGLNVVRIRDAPLAFLNSIQT